MAHVIPKVLSRIISERNELQAAFSKLVSIVTRYCPVLLNEDINSVTPNEVQKRITNYYVSHYSDCVIECMSQKQVLQTLKIHPQTTSMVASKYIKEFLKPLSTVEFGLKIVGLLDLPWGKYQLLRKLFAMEVQRTKWNSRIFKILATKEEVQREWKLLSMQHLKLNKLTKVVTIEDIPKEIISYECSILAILNYIFGSPILKSLVLNPDNLEVIFRMDAFPVGGRQGLLAAITLKNFGSMCHLPTFQFLTNVANIGDKDHDQVRFALGQNLHLLNNMAQTRKIYIHSLLKAVNCQIRVGGDDPVLRLLFGLKASNSLHLSIYCQCIRGTVTNM